MSATIVARHIAVRGRVQGVCYRDWTTTTARGLGLAGWVRNRPDGSVEIVAEGEAHLLDALASACREGPPAARVDAVDVDEIAPAGRSGFERRATG